MNIHRLDRITCLLSVGCVFLAGVVPVFGAAEAAKPELKKTDTITRHGITWKLSAPASVGRFVNGDYYVVGAVTVASITPKPTADRNGSVLNLPANPIKAAFKHIPGFTNSA